MSSFKPIEMRDKRVASGRVGNFNGAADDAHEDRCCGYRRAGRLRRIRVFRAAVDAENAHGEV